MLQYVARARLVALSHQLPPLMRRPCLQMAMYRKLGFSKDDTSPDVDFEEPHGYTILSKAIQARSGGS